MPEHEINEKKQIRSNMIALEANLICMVVKITESWAAKILHI